MIILANILDEVLETLILKRKPKLANNVLEALGDDEIVILNNKKNKMNRKFKYKKWLENYMKKRIISNKYHKPSKKNSRLMKRIKRGKYVL